MKSKIYDILIVGGGPMGIATAIEANDNKLTSIVIEKGSLVNSIYNFPDNMTFFSTSEKLEIGNVPFLSINEKPTRNEALEYYRRVINHCNVNINLSEEVIEITKSDDIFTIITSKNKYLAKNIVIATGFYGQHNKLNAVGENLPKVSYYYKEPHQYIHKKVVVVGAGNSACQVALELYHKGIDVTMIIRKNEVKPTVKYWIKPNIENRIEEGSIKVYFEAEVTKIEEKSIEIIQKGKNITIENDVVLALIGYQPNYEFLKSVGVAIDNDEFLTPNHSKETFETNIKGIYLAGVVCGGLKTNTYLIENSKIHAVKIVKDIIK